MSMGRSLRAFVVAWLLVFAGGFIASDIQTDGGSVKLTNVRFPLTGGGTMSGLLYRPATATPEHPAPAVIAAHGFINTREMQSAFAIELARRGFVVLAIDMPGHGHSDGIVGASGFGGPDALSFVRRLKFVDANNIGLEGHSMGGGAVMGATLAQPEGYKSAVLVGSTPKFGGEFVKPRNLAIVFGTYEEFAGLMWKVPRGDAVATSASLQKFFGTQQPVKPHHLYGSINAGTARQLYLVPAIHPQEHASSAAVAAVTDWFGKTLVGERPASNARRQSWQWKEAGTLASLVGGLLLIVSTFALLLKTRWFAALAMPVEPSAPERDRNWALRFAIIGLLPAVLFIPLMVLSQSFGPTPLFPQLVHNQVLTWAAGSALVTSVLFQFRKTPRWAVNRHIVLGIAAALVSVLVAYAALVAVDQFFITDMRFWIWGGRPFSGLRFVIALPYFLCWTAYFALTFRGIVQQLVVGSNISNRLFATFALAMAGGMALFAAAEYGRMLLAHRLLIPDYPLLAILSLHFVPVLLVTAVIGAFIVKRTNDYLPAALICGCLLTWHVVTSTANHWAPGYEVPVLPFAAAR
jgi:pimeloyl-ACP methyl ester carboxylesterase